MQSGIINPTVLVYDGEGAGSRSVLSAVDTLRNSLSPQVKVDQLGPEELLSGSWQEGCLMLVMPGGADLPYCRQLNGDGNRLIRGFVENGGAYLGLCAGAYYACSYVEFALGTKLEVKGPRELAFFPGTAAGPVYNGFRYESEQGAHAARVAFKPPLTSMECAASPADACSQEQRAQPLTKPAPDAFAGWQTCRDYTNGGPRFVPHADMQTAAADRAGQLSTDEFHQPTFEQLAVYPDKGNALAAVRCGIGAGIAVLVGTHPELDTRWLCGLPETTVAENLGPALKVQQRGDDEASNIPSRNLASTDSVRRQLEKCKAERHFFWIMLLQSAGMGNYLLNKFS